MYNAKLLSFILILFFVGLLSSQEYLSDVSFVKKLDGFERIKDLSFEDEYIYVLEYDNERITVLDYDLNKKSKINMGRRYLRDFVVYDGAVYATQSLGLFRVYPTRKNISNSVSSVSSFSRDKDYFYLAFYNGLLEKMDENGDVVKKIRLENHLYDIALSLSHVYVSSDYTLYILDKDLEIENKKSFSEKIKGISYYEGFILITTKSFVYFYTPDLREFKILQLSLLDDCRVTEFNKFYLVPNYNTQLLGFDNTTVCLFDTSIIPPVEEIDQLKKKNSLSIDQLVVLSQYLGNESYGMALSYLRSLEKSSEEINEVNIFEKNNSLENDNETSSSPNFGAATKSEKDNSFYLMILLSVSLLMFIFIILIFIAYKMSKKQ